MQVIPIEEFPLSRDVIAYIRWLSSLEPYDYCQQYDDILEEMQEADRRMAFPHPEDEAKP